MAAMSSSEPDYHRPEIGLVVTLSLILLILSNGPLIVAAREIWDRPGSWEDPLVRPAIIGAVVMAAVLWLRLALARKLQGFPFAVLPAAVFTLVAIVSASWSVSPALTRWRSPVYIGLLLAAWLLASLPASDIHRILLSFVGIAVTASLAVIALAPKVGLDPSGIWRGLYTGPNSLSPLAGLLALLAIPGVAHASFKIRAASVVLLALAFLTLAKTDSVTALGGLVLAASTSTLLWALRKLVLAKKPRLAGLVGTGLIALSAGLAAIFWDSIWATSSLSLRAELWGFVWDHISLVPVKGHGFFGFWSNPRYTVPRLLARSGSAHNSPLEVLLGIGIIGFVPYLGVVTMSLLQPVRDLWRHNDLQAWIWLSVVLFLTAENLTESFVLWFSYNWVLVMASAMRSPRPVLCK